jgi:hypothetical protein
MTLFPGRRFAHIEIGLEAMLRLQRSILPDNR